MQNNWQHFNVTVGDKTEVKGRNSTNALCGAHLGPEPREEEDGQGRRWIRVWCDGGRVLGGRFVTLQRIGSKEEDSRR